jgi:hypothetical protein
MLNFFVGRQKASVALENNKMKLHYAIWSLGFLMALWANECQANLDGCDNFIDNSIDPSRWATNVAGAGVGLVTETRQRLEYTTGGAPTGSDRASAVWILNTGSYSNNWEVQVDFNMPSLNLTNGQSVSFTLLVYPDANLANRFEFHLNQYSVNSFQWEMDVQVNNTPATQITTNTLSGSVAGRIAFDATAKTLSASFDEDGANCGYSWNLLGAATVPSVWNLTSNSVFNAVIGADSRNTMLASSNNVFLDNFKAASGSFPPLKIQRAGGSVAISWPTNAPNFHLESTATLSSSICWSVLTNVTTIVGTNFSVTDAILSQTKFFRLSRNYGCP